MNPRKVTWNENSRKVRSSNVLANETALVDAWATPNPANGVERADWGYGEVTPYGVGNDNGTFIMDVAFRFKTVGDTIINRTRLVASVTCTLGTLVGTAGAYLINTERAADGIVVAETPFATMLAQKYGLIDPVTGTPQLVIPNHQNNNGSGSFMIAEFHDAFDILFAFRAFTNVTEANALIDLHT